MIPHTIEKAKPYRLTFEQFRDAYRNSPWRGSRWSMFWDCMPGALRSDGTDKRTRLESIDWYRLAFNFRFRVPNAQGFFADGPEAAGASWCWPWQFYRRYYDVRFPS